MASFVKSTTPTMGSSGLLLGKSPTSGMSRLPLPARVTIRTPSATRPAIRACFPVVTLPKAGARSMPASSLGKPRPWLPSLLLRHASFRCQASAAATSGQGEEGERKFLGMSTLTWAKVIPLGIMFFFILFNYTLLRNTKDVLIVTAPGGGAEIIPFLKTYATLPSAIAFTIAYAKLTSVFDPQACFMIIMAAFLTFFGGFAFAMYPNLDLLHPHGLADRLLESAPRAAAPIAILRNWTFALFYVMAEMWGSVVVALLFWGTANSVCTVDEAQTFYPLFGLSANIALVVAGAATKYFAKARATLPPGADGWAFSLKGLMGLVVLGGFVVTAAYSFLQMYVRPKLGDIKPLPSKKKKGGKAKMSVGESFKFLASSPYIRSLALVVVCYGVSINLVEVTWKSKLRAAFPDPNDYSSFMAEYSSWTGIVTFAMMLVSRWVFAKFGWGTAALITPTVMMATGAAFFGCVLFSTQLEPTMAMLSVTPLMAAVLIGAFQNVFSKASKYSLFDPCKEMAYIPLDQETQLRGKAAIDVVCSPLGKSGGSLIQQFLIVVFGSLAASTPYLGVILLGIVAVWIGAANTLSKLFEQMQTEQLEEKRSEAKRALLRMGSMSRKYKLDTKENEAGFLESRVTPIQEEEGAANGASQLGDGSGNVDEPVSARDAAALAYRRALTRSLSSKSNRGGAGGFLALPGDHDSEDGPQLQPQASTAGSSS